VDLEASVGERADEGLEEGHTHILHVLDVPEGHERREMAIGEERRGEMKSEK
jgi:hypothetical protein